MERHRPTSVRPAVTFLWRRLTKRWRSGPRRKSCEPRNLWRMNILARPAHISSLATAPVIERDTARIVSGLALSVSSVGFVGVFGVLASRFAYPKVLEWPGEQILRALADSDLSVRVAWGLYAILPLSISVAARFSTGVFRSLPPFWAKIGTYAGIASGVSMSVALLRWTTLYTALASSLETANLRQAAHIVDWTNLWLGKILGEFVGEILLGTFSLSLASALISRRTRIVAALLGTLGSLLWVGAFRWAIPPLSVVSSITNLLLPLTLVVFGGFLAFSKRAAR